MQSDKRIAIPIMTHPGIEFLGKDVTDAVKDGAVHAAAIIELNKRYPAAASTVIMDLTVEAEAFGAEIAFAPGEVPNVLGRLVEDRTSVEKLQVPSLSAGRVPEYLKANRLVAETIKDKPVFAGCIGPFSLAGRLFGMTEIMMAIYIEPDTVKLLLEKCSEFIEKYILAIKETGVNGIIMAEPAAGLLSNDDATAYSSVYIKKIVEKVQDESFLFTLHNCGNTGHCTESMVCTGAKALHFGNKIDIAEALKGTPSDILVMGNIDPVSAFKQGTAAEMQRTVEEILEKTKSYRNFILSSGCDTPPGVPEENIDAFYETLAKFNS